MWSQLCPHVSLRQSPVLLVARLGPGRWVGLSLWITTMLTPQYPGVSTIRWPCPTGYFLTTSPCRTSPAWTASEWRWARELVTTGFVTPVGRLRPACAGCSRSCRTTREAGDGAVLTVTVTAPLVRLGVRAGGGTVSPQDCRRTGWSSQPSPTATRRLWVLTPRDQRRTPRVVSSAWQTSRRERKWDGWPACISSTWTASTIGWQGRGSVRTVVLMLRPQLLSSDNLSLISQCYNTA